MTTNIGKASMLYIVDLIIRDMGDYLESSVRKLNFISEEKDGINEMLADWLEMFEDYPKGFEEEERDEIIQEIGEQLGSMTIWSHDESEVKEITEAINSYFGEFQGFSKLVNGIYKTSLKEEWIEI